jgi:hypothetical protein
VIVLAAPSRLALPDRDPRRPTPTPAALRLAEDESLLLRAQKLAPPKLLLHMKTTTTPTELRVADVLAMTTTIRIVGTIDPGLMHMTRGLGGETHTMSVPAEGTTMIGTTRDRAGEISTRSATTTGLAEETDGMTIGPAAAGTLAMTIDCSGTREMTIRLVPARTGLSGRDRPRTCFTRMHYRSSRRRVRN